MQILKQSLFLKKNTIYIVALMPIKKKVFILKKKIGVYMNYSQPYIYGYQIQWGCIYFM